MFVLSCLMTGSRRVELRSSAWKRTSPAFRADASMVYENWKIVFPAYIAGGPQGRPLLQAWLWPSRGVRVIYGQPVDLSVYRHRRLTRQVIQEVTALLMQRIGALRPAASGKVSELVSSSRNEQTCLDMKA